TKAGPWRAARQLARVCSETPSSAASLPGVKSFRAAPTLQATSGDGAAIIYAVHNISTEGGHQTSASIRELPARRLVPLSESLAALRPLCTRCLWVHPGELRPPRPQR